MKKTTKILIITGIFLMFLMPALSSAVLVPCDNSAGQPCNFSALLQLVNSVIDYLLLLAMPIAAIMFAYAGFLLVTAGGESAGAKTKAKSIFINAVFGFIIALAAWLIVKLILTTLGFQTNLF
ncbi:MAG: pilin [Candidatus Paceibacterota bacterium]|jgi:hypothetical protein